MWRRLNNEPDWAHHHAWWESNSSQADRQSKQIHTIWRRPSQRVAPPYIERFTYRNRTHEGGDLSETTRKNEEN